MGGSNLLGENQLNRLLFQIIEKNKGYSFLRGFLLVKTTMSLVRISRNTGGYARYAQKSTQKACA